MEEELVIKKMYIKDYVLNPILLKHSLNKSLNQVLSVFYKRNIDNIINNIIDDINNIYKEDNKNNKIFNLSYQDWNIYNIGYDYDNDNINKKWIIPII